jgi:hypothetical protein
MPQSVLRLDQLRKSYGETVALDGVSFDPPTLVLHTRTSVGWG